MCAPALAAHLIPNHVSHRIYLRGKKVSLFFLLPQLRENEVMDLIYRCFFGMFPIASIICLQQKNRI